MENNKFENVALLCLRYAEQKTVKNKVKTKPLISMFGGNVY